jgi:ABC transport system ATP-binding/permease protein
VTETGSFKLIIEDDEGRRSVVPIDLGEVSLGRLEGNTIRLNERNVSRRHARLFKENGGVIAEDLDSYNGIFINGDRVKSRHDVRDGDVLRIGDFQLELRGEGLASRTEETTQRTNVPDTEATQPEIRMGSGPQQPISAKAAAATEEQPEARAEPTAIIRMSHLDDVEAARRDGKAAIAGQKAKLLCVSTQFAGREFEVTKTEMVIGRTEDNDIPIDHRSVSRHHAKIVVAGKSFKVVDLKSANGTLINGEEYAQADVKKGDLIEFGHVKFRFVPPGENYSFTPDELQAIQKGDAGEPDATVPGTAPARPSTSPLDLLRTNQLLVIAIGALGVAVVVLIVWLLSSTSEDKGARGSPQDRPIADSSKSPPAPPTIEPNGPGQPAAGSEADRLVARANAAMVQRQWQQAATLARAALAMNPEHIQAQEVVARADAEAEAQGAYDAAVAAINSNNWSQAWNRLQEIPEKSSFAVQAKSLMIQVKGALVSDKVTAADRAVQTGDLEAADQLVTEINLLEPGRPDLMRLMKEISKARESQRRDASKKSRTPTKKASAIASPSPTPAPTPPKPEPAPAATGEDPKQLYLDGAKALKDNQTDKAIDIFSHCIKVDPKSCACYRAMGIVHAKAHNGPKAYRYYKQYLKTCPTASDAADVERLLKQYEQQQ